MLVNIVSWGIIFYILFTFGDILLSLYIKICKQSEQYNILDRLLLGLCSLIIPLSVWSLWLPSNHAFLFLILIVSILYWGINYRKIVRTCENIIDGIKPLTQSQIILLLLFILVSLFFFTWQQEVYDSAFYHYQNIRWNEEYPVVPGIANIDDRFGFNSNYFLLSAIFTFRFILGEAIYPLQGILVTAIGCWILYELFRSRYDVKRIIILAAYILLCWVSVYFLGNTSTDVLPNFIAFYILARLVLSPDLLKSNYLLGIVLPVFLLTCKLSFFPIGIISLYLIYILIKEKKYGIISFGCIIGLFIVVLWLIRNVIVSGYLIFPLYQIDLFNFDWKVPQEIAIREKDYIFDIGYYFFRIALRYPHESIRDPFVINILTDIIYLLTLVSFVIAAYTCRKGNKTRQHIYLLYAIFLVTLIVWATGGPDIRFVSGVLCAVISTGSILLIKDKKIYLAKTGNILICLFITGALLWTGSRYYPFYSEIENTETPLTLHVITKPFSVKDQQMTRGIDIYENFDFYPINNEMVIRVSHDLPYDMPPPASIRSHYAKFLPLECIEARGWQIQDGFRAKEGCR